MKLKWMLITMGICLVISFIILEWYIDAQQYNACDLIELNDTEKRIEADFGSKSMDEIEYEYSCNIVLREDPNYSKELFSAIRNSDIIMDYMDGDRLIGKIIFPANSNTFSVLKKNLQLVMAAAFAIVLLILLTAVYIIQRKIVRPFQKLQHFANLISVGNLDLPLAMDKENYFGAFTESFDLMREELKRARQGEYEANVSKKELVAELSHDIKTPVATIKALCELLEVKVKDEDTIAKLRTINQKADVIDKLISNLFHATLEELEVLKIEPREVYSTILIPMLEDLNYYGRIHRKNELPECLIYCDQLRLNQVIDNIINNSYKYAGTDIDVFFKENGESIEIEIRDYGNGISESEIPLVFEKFYRGENASAHSGAGLGLYLAKKFMEGMDGVVQCRVDQGFIVKLTIKKV